ncbi:MAG: hypothetical protein KIG43_05420 [Eubacteriales bacterium]|nr:hypothetical protein [Eubacteriales bacterium]MCI7570465.1 DRTGG domain-containing protein [Clostridiales bacterium]MDD7550678.1 DRTGG domain-containing protein [Clostridia bacterium]MDY5754106.1 DRTGG domain-containing protein [Eubacteriales bacterium]
MKISDVVEVLGCSVICGEQFLDLEVDNAFGSDMMSDVLAYVKPTTLVLTGMVNSHVIRTAEMLEIRCILFVRGKVVTEDLIEHAKQNDLVLLSTPMTLYEACGKLYSKGMPPCSKE